MGLGFCRRAYEFCGGLSLVA